MELKFYIDVDEKVIIEAFYGAVSISGIEKVIPFIYKHPDYNRQFDAIIDLRNANSSFTKQALYDFLKIYAENEDLILGRIAVLVSEPMSAAMATLYDEEMSGYHSLGIFCSESEVHHFLQTKPDIFSKIDHVEKISLK